MSTQHSKNEPGTVKAPQQVNLQTHHDRALRRGEADLLNRRPFVDHFSKILASAPRGESVVYALYAKWGEGKSSVLTLIEEAFSDPSRHKSPPCVIHFNPWVFSNRKELFHAFFEDIANSIGLSSIDKPDEKAKKWKALGATASLIGGAIEDIDVALSLVGLSIPLAKLGGKIGKKVQSVTDAAATTEEAKKPKSLKAVKDELAAEMENAEQPILIVLDDIDRLLPDDLVELLHLLKAIADIPNVHYLLLCDREIVEANLEQKTGQPHYLEKIVQFSSTLPKVPDHKLREYLANEIVLLTKTAAYNDSRVGDELLGEIHKGPLPKCFKNLRALKRFLGNLKISFTALCNKGYFELHPADFLHLEALRHLTPASIPFIIDHEHVFTTSWESSDPFSPKTNGEELISKFKNESLKDFISEQKKPILRELFSKLIVYSEYNPANENIETRRLHSTYWFNCYFTIDTSEVPAALSIETIQKIWESHSKVDELEAIFDESLDKHGITPIIRTLIHHMLFLDVDDPNLAHSNLLTSLLSSLEKAHKHSNDILEYIDYHFGGESDPTFIDTIISAILESNNYTAACQLVIHWEQLRAQEADEAKFDWDSRIKEISKLAINLIEIKAHKNELYLHSMFGTVQTVWERYGNYDALTQWLSHQTAPSEGLVEYLKSIGRFNHKYESQDESTISFQLATNLLIAFENPKDMASRCEAYLSQANDSNEKLIFEAAIEHFNKAQEYHDGEKFFRSNLPNLIDYKIQTKLDALIESPSFIIMTRAYSRPEATNKDIVDFTNYLRDDLAAEKAEFSNLLTIGHPDSSAVTPCYLVETSEETALKIARNHDQPAVYGITSNNDLELISCNGEGRMRLGRSPDMFIA